MHVLYLIRKLFSISRMQQCFNSLLVKEIELNSNFKCYAGFLNVNL